MKFNLSNVNWGEFVFEDIFTIRSTNSGIDKNKLNNSQGQIPYITRTDKNNAIDFFIGVQDPKYKIDNGNVITIGLDTQTVFYQPHSFYTGQNIQILSNINLNYYTSLFLIPLIKIQMEKFNWGGNGATLTRLKRSKIILPTSSNILPDYTFMEQFMRYKETEKVLKLTMYINRRIEKIKNFKEVKSLKNREWKEFKIDDVFVVSTGSLIPKEILKIGEIPRLTATDNQNGIFNFYEKVEHKNYREVTNFISVSFLGSVFYHPYSASLDMKIHAVQIRELPLNQYLAEFLVFCFKRMASKYSYGDQLSSTDLPKKKILLPITEKGQPDYDYMENYIKKIEYEKLRKYIERKTTNI